MTNYYEVVIIHKVIASKWKKNGIDEALKTVGELAGVNAPLITFKSLTFTERAEGDEIDD